MWIGTRRSVSAGTLLFILALVCAALLALPGQTVVTRYLNDLFLILDGAHRVAWGEVPHRDFRMPLGPLTAYVPAVGYALTGSFGAAMPVGMALLILALSPAVVQILTSRLHPVIALLYGAFLILVLAVPTNLGETVTSLTFSKFYNRIGWVALGALLIMYLPPRHVRAGQDRRDLLSAAFLVLVMAYTKATYGVVALAFLAFMLFDRRQRRWAAGALGLALVAGLVVELFWRSSLSYVADLRLALDVSGAVRGTRGQIIDHVLGNLADYVLAALVAGLALAYTRSLRDAVFYCACAVVGFLLVNQNFQVWGILTLHAASAVAAETIVRATDDGRNEVARGQWSITAGAKLLLAAMTLPAIVQCTLTLGLHAGAAVTKAGDEIAFPNLDRVRLANLWTWGDHDTALEYLATVREGVDILAKLGNGAAPVAVLDIANPFSAALGLRPAKGDASWLQWERTVGSRAHPRPENLFADVRTVMEPKPAAGSDAAAALAAGRHPAALYAPYLAAHFDLVRETDHWKLHRRPEKVQTSCGSNCSPAAVQP
jgi:hypothetical protein